MSLFRCLVWAAFASLAGVLYTAVLIEAGMLGRLWFDLVLVTGLIISCAALFAGLLLELDDER